jgi:hypothetical protein|tara:strand:+ start:249 stop:452 length:204 start_codon:yes stop_codon:yes gene_type:complete
MKTLMATQTIANAHRYIKNGDKVKATPVPKKSGLLLRRMNDTMQDTNEPEAVSLLRRVQKSIANAKT